MPSSCSQDILLPITPLLLLVITCACLFPLLDSRPLGNKECTYPIHHRIPWCWAEHMPISSSTLWLVFFSASESPWTSPETSFWTKEWCWRGSPDGTCDEDPVPGSLLAGHCSPSEQDLHQRLHAGPWVRHVSGVTIKMTWCFSTKRGKQKEANWADFFNQCQRATQDNSTSGKCGQRFFQSKKPPICQTLFYICFSF